MITAREASLGIYGAWRLARLDSNGVQYFENTVEAFWRSFHAALIVLPAYVILVLLRIADHPPAVGPVQVLLIHGIAYVIGWFALPFVMYYVTGWFDLRDRYFRYIGAYNWAQVLQVALLLPVTAVVASGMLSAAAAGPVLLVTTLALLFYEGFIACAALRIPPIGAVGIVIIDFIIKMTLSGITDSLMRPPG